MISQQRQPFPQPLFGVDVSTDEPAHEDCEQGAENDPFDYDTFLQFVSVTANDEVCVENTVDVHQYTKTHHPHNTALHHHRTRHNIFSVEP
jgi:hypothetical protein